MRLLILQCSQFALYVCTYICMLYTMSCIYPSHFNCVGAESVVSFPDYEPHGTGSTKRLTCEKEHVRAEMQQGPHFHPTLVIVLSYLDMDIAMYPQKLTTLKQTSSKVYH